LDRDSGRINDRQFYELSELLQPNDLLVLNDTKVIPARIYAHKATGAKIEILLERLIERYQALAHIHANRSPKLGQKIYTTNGHLLRITGRQDDLFCLESQDLELRQLFHQEGEMPLPPYIERKSNDKDRVRYQTCYAKKEGAVAAPTAGLHFDHSLLTALTQQGVNIAQLTLHVGAGTFQSVRVENIHTHKMHAEYMEVTQTLCDQIVATQNNGGRIIAVGTTCVRALEAAYDSRLGLQPYAGETDIFIYPGYRFRVIDGMITNFHLPESTLLMLVCAFAGYDRIMNAYQHAITNQYRFYSYGDAMLVLG
jgi:S-adenosylmethionine:tRNA ribosyltransferase-isomerase